MARPLAPLALLLTPLALPSGPAAAQCEVHLAPGLETLGDHFGASVDVDGDRAAFGEWFLEDAPGGTGRVHVLARTGAAWATEAELAAPPSATEEAYGTQFGYDVALDGALLAVGAPGWSDASTLGGVHVFRREAAGWVLEATLHAPDPAPYDAFGHSVALDGDRLAASDRDRKVHLYRREGASWTLEQTIGLADPLTAPVVALDGDRLLVGAPGADGIALGAGSASTYVRTGTTWAFEQELVPAGLALFDGYGGGVALDGDLAVVGAPGDDGAGPGVGVAYVWRLDLAGWALEDELAPSAAGSYARFGQAVAVEGEAAVVGAPDEGLDAAGAARLYRYAEGTWLEAAQLAPSSPAPPDRLGRDVALSGDTSFVAAGQNLPAAALAFAVGGDCNENGEPDACDVLAGASLDLDGDGGPDECQALSADVAAVSVSEGGAQTLALDAGPAHAGSIHWLVGSVTGTSPGFSLLGQHVPLNPDVYLAATVGAPGLPPLANPLGLLDADGTATASFWLPPASDPLFVGLVAHHAFGVFDPATLALELVSNALPVAIAP